MTSNNKNIKVYAGNALGQAIPGITVEGAVDSDYKKTLASSSSFDLFYARDPQADFIITAPPSL